MTQSTHTSASAADVPHTPAAAAAAAAPAHAAHTRAHAAPSLSLYRRAQQTFHGMSMRHTLLACWAVGTVFIYSTVGGLAREKSVTPEQLRAHEQKMEEFRRQHAMQQSAKQQ